MGATLPPGWKGTVLAARGQGNSLARCAAIANIAPSTIKRWVSEDEEFSEDWDAASETMRDSLRDEMWVRGFDRNDKESARILLWLGEHYLPEGRTKGELALTGSDGGPIKVTQGVATLAEVFALLEAQGGQAAHGVDRAEARPEVESGSATRRALPVPSEAMAEPR